MNVEALAARIYAQKGFHPSDFQRADLRAGMLIVSPVRPPKVSQAGIITEVAWDTIPDAMLMLYTVVAVAEQQPSYAVKVAPGDVVVVRTAHLDPLQPSKNGRAGFCTIYSKHVVCKLQDGGAPEG